MKVSQTKILMPWYYQSCTLSEVLNYLYGIRHVMVCHPRACAVATKVMYILKVAQTLSVSDKFSMNLSFEYAITLSTYTLLSTSLENKFVFSDPMGTMTKSPSFDNNIIQINIDLLNKIKSLEGKKNNSFKA